jgi:hypothetical protein
MRPAQFVTQCVTIWERLIKQPHVAEIRRIEAAPEFLRQSLGQPRQQLRPILRARRAALLEFDNVPPHAPTSPHMHHIHRPQDLPPAFRDEFAQFTQQPVEAGLRGLEGIGLFLRWSLLFHGN